jgi:SPP1 gp7 family putative phage head morphogenesis protein
MILRTESLYKALELYWLSTMEDAFEYVNDLYNFDLSFDLLNERFKNHIEKYGLEQAKGINSTTKDALRKTLTEGVEAGESIPKLRQRITDVYAEVKGYRTRRIAITETHNTVSAGTFETYKGAGLEKKEWKTSIDGRERETHRKIDGEVVEIDKLFSNGLMYPGDAGGEADEVVNCRCVLLPVIPEEE